MNRKLKLIFLIASAISSTTAFAHDSGDNAYCAGPLCAIKSNGGAYVGFTGLWLRPSETGIGTFSDSWQYTSGNLITATSKPISPRYKWQWSFKLGLDIPCTADSLEVDYLTVSSRTHAVNTSFSPEQSSSFASVFFPDAAFPTPAAVPFTSNAHLSYSIRQWDAKIMRHFGDGKGFDAKLGFGLRYARLKHSLYFIFPGFVTSRYSGTGPMVSLDARYGGFWNQFLGGMLTGFGLVGHFDAALLAGKVTSTNSISPPVLFAPNFSRYVQKHTDRIVTSLSAKLGVDYNALCWGNYRGTIEAGYQVNTYINSFDILRGYAAIGVPASGTTTRITGVETTSLGFRGPYVELNVHI